MPTNRIPIFLVLVSVLIAVLVTPWNANNIFLDVGDSGEGKPTPLRAARILLLTAHPDDEAFFFGPTVISLASHLRGDRSAGELYSLCLSTGDAIGLGDIRKGELVRSLDVLGIAEGRRWVLDKEGLKDNFTATWDANLIADVVRPYVIEHQISTILTFDHRGVSYHPNHRSLFHGVSHLLSTISDPPKAYALISLPTIAKYVSVVAPLLAKLDIAFARAVSYFGYPSSDIPVFVAGAKDYVTAARALREHKSQMIWFRWLYLGFSRYMWVNEWVEILAAVTQ